MLVWGLWSAGWSGRAPVQPLTPNAVPAAVDDPMGDEPGGGASTRLAEREAVPLEERPVRATFSVKVNDVVTPYSTFATFVMPGETVVIEPLFEQPNVSYMVTAETGLVQPPTATDPASRNWTWTAPIKPGVYRVRVHGPLDVVVLHVFVKTPFDNDDPVLEGYRIGSYERTPMRGDPQFLPPTGLIEVNEKTADVPVSPHFTLGQFACHQPGDPKYLLLDERLVLKLEMLLEEAQRQGLDAETFTIMSGYRTPWYNKSIGNTTSYSLHLFGRASDIFVDDDGDGRMDDLNGDGRVTAADARMLYDLVDGVFDESWYQPFVGGLGFYGPKPHRGPFIHVDVRGYRARW